MKRTWEFQFLLMYPKIQNGAILIADTHEDDKRDGFYSFLQKIESNKIVTTQLFLMGDMFDLFIGKIEYSVQKYQKYIDMLEKIALNIEVFYFEGNHDFSLSNLFKNVKTVPIQLQPKKFILKDNTLIYLSHGDKYCGFIYNNYTKIIRLSIVLKILNIVDKMCNNFISKKIKSNQSKKKLCIKIKDFEKIIRLKILQYNIEQKSWIIEGHYHQNSRFKINKVNYINLPSFACGGSYFIVECLKHKKEFFKELGC
ncbi:MAG: metallophosphoesterase [Sulfurospirillum sp.]|nr:metallophosphoesterase [Sulfurospirillum sp.]